MDQGDIYIGQVVRSTMGRDKGKHFIVFKIEDEDHVLVVDGFIRRVEKPKKKKKKHLKRLNLMSEEISKSVTNALKINNAFIRKELERLGFQPKAKNGGSMSECLNKM
ncbi:RNA-binding protein [Serpentinicella sp. ANB-PHB4]|uniref:RNA-binding protein n=1 Tax=Serpentinicella sp. ANB-PHB4 TaxID=3074076 RepID=UPI00285AC822|nr:RNA-binding protein [Serpentinicella sp. ANB-PHB4]MDR5659529.1 RNA-binding protein [Serpentinicella sp. ANB-PHB4]